MNLESILLALGPWGIVLVMFLESSILPVPSEIVFIAAGALSGKLGISHVQIALFGALGSALGAIVGYAIGEHGARPVLVRWGKYIGITLPRLEATENFAKKHGLLGVLVGRLTPIIPFKVFSIASGIVKLPFWGFVFFTFVGTLPRAYILSSFGDILKKYTLETVSASFVLIGAYFVFVKWREWRASRRKKNKRVAAKNGR